MLQNVNNNAINNTSFRYTIDDARRSWTKLLFPYLMKNFMHIVKEIPWESYTYNGPSYAQEAYIDEDGNDAYLPVHTIDVRAEGMPYYVFGGAVCEILNKKYKTESGVDLRNYVDPTGDFDVQFFYDRNIIYDNPHDVINIVAYNEAGARSGIHYNTINHVVDVRGQEEWDYGHYSGAYHIPVRNIPTALPRTLPDRSKSLLFYGGVGGDRAYKAARLAQDLGYNTVGYLEQGDYKGLEHLNPPTRG
jgi:rhodanese-related sulfurtransferase